MKARLTSLEDATNHVAALTMGSVMRLNDKQAVAVEGAKAVDLRVRCVASGDSVTGRFLVANRHHAAALRSTVELMRALRYIVPEGESVRDVNDDERRSLEAVRDELIAFGKPH